MKCCSLSWISHYKLVVQKSQTFHFAWYNKWQWYTMRVWKAWIEENAFLWNYFPTTTFKVVWVFHIENYWKQWFQTVAHGPEDRQTKVFENLDLNGRLGQASRLSCGNRSKQRTLQYSSLTHWLLQWQVTHEELLHHLSCLLSIGGGSFHYLEKCCYCQYLFYRSELLFHR